MTDKPTPVNRPLTDAERSLMHHLAAAVLAQQTGVPIEAAQQVLIEDHDNGSLHLVGDAYECRLTLNGKTLVHVTREFLAFHAAHPDEVIDLDKYGHPLDPNQDSGR